MDRIREGRLIQPSRSEPQIPSHPRKRPVRGKIEAKRDSSHLPMLRDMCRLQDRQGKSETREKKRRFTYFVYKILGTPPLTKASNNKPHSQYAAKLNKLSDAFSVTHPVWNNCLDHPRPPELPDQRTIAWKSRHGGRGKLKGFSPPLSF